MAHGETGKRQRPAAHFLRFAAGVTAAAALSSCGSLAFWKDDETGLRPHERMGNPEGYTGMDEDAYRRGYSRGWSDGFDAEGKDIEAHRAAYSSITEDAFKDGYKAGYKSGKKARSRDPAE